MCTDTIADAARAAPTARRTAESTIAGVDGSAPRAELGRTIGDADENLREVHLLTARESRPALDYSPP